MKNQVSEFQTVRLGPGVFPTTGDSLATGWSLKNGMRILGSGVSTTSLKMTVSSGVRSVLGYPYSPIVPLSGGFEASDFTIDCNFIGGSLPANSARRAIFVYGTHILLRRLRVINFGATISGLNAAVTFAAVDSEDCVMEDCTVENPGVLSGTPQIALVQLIGTSTQPHRFCVVRNCYLSGSPTAATPASIFGIVPGAGLGLIVEENQLKNLGAGIYDGGDFSSGAPDLVIRNNYIRNVTNGVRFFQSSSQIGRLILHDNTIEVATANSAGISILGSGSIRYNTLIIRKNIIRDVNWSATNSIWGIDVSYGTDVNVENNLINNTSTANGVKRVNNTYQRIENNRNTAGALVQ